MICLFYPTELLNSWLEYQYYPLNFNRAVLKHYALGPHKMGGPWGRGFWDTESRSDEIFLVMDPELKSRNILYWFFT